MSARLAGFMTLIERLRGTAGLAAVCFVFALLTASPWPAHAAEVQAQVTDVAADGALKLALPAGHAVRAGDMVTVSTEMPGIGRVNLQTRWRVTNVSGDVATAAAAGPVSGLPKPGFAAVIVTTGQGDATRATPVSGNSLDGNRKKAEAGNVEAMLRLGYHHLGDFPLTATATPDPQQAVHWLSMAAQRNNAAAACALAGYYRTHNDAAQALRFTRQAAEGGDPGCQYALGMALLNGNGVAKNPTEAAIWISKAAQAEVLPARYQYAKLHLHGIGVKQDPGRALQMFHYLANHDGVPGAMFWTGILLRGGNPQEALSWMRKAAEAGHPLAMYQMGSYYATGTDVARDESQARNWFTKAVKKGEFESMIMLAFMYEHGVAGQRNSREAALLAMKAFRGGAVHTDTILQRPQDYSAAFWKAVQTQLKQAGVYKGRIDGRFTKATSQAIEAVIKKGA